MAHSDGVRWEHEALRERQQDPTPPDGSHAPCINWPEWLESGSS